MIFQPPCSGISTSNEEFMAADGTFVAMFNGPVIKSQNPLPIPHWKVLLPSYRTIQFEVFPLSHETRQSVSAFPESNEAIPRPLCPGSPNRR
jgi:hypothetical protein